MLVRPCPVSLLLVAPRAGRCSAGVFTAEDGAAEGLESTDIGVSEDSSLAAGQSLQLVGTGSVYSDFSWTADVVESFGAINDGLDLGEYSTRGKASRLDAMWR